MADPAKLYSDFAHINAVVMQTIPGGSYGFSRVGRYQHEVESWAVAGRADDGTWYRYYFVELDSILTSGVAGTMKVNGYILSCHLVDGVTGAALPGVQLLGVTPDTTQGSTSYTTSMNESVSASGGFFGDSPTASVGDTVTFGHSVTRSVPDVTVHNNSLSQDGQNATWTLGLAENALAQSDALEFTAQMLFRVPSKSGDTSSVALRLDFSAALEDHDNNGSGYFDRSMAGIRSQLGAIVTTPISDRGCWFGFPSARTVLKNPAIPVSLAAGS
jgi:hypothetical protein